jgi:hypothetical protein
MWFCHVQQPNWEEWRGHLHFAACWLHGCWLLAAGCWLLAAGCWLLAVI